MMSKPFHTKLDRRDFLAASVGATAFSLADFSEGKEPNAPVPYQATGVRIGEMTPTSALLWMRLTRNSERLNDGVVIPQRKRKKTDPPIDVPADQIEGACPGAPGYVRVRYSTTADFSDAVVTDWVEVDEKTDYSHLFPLTDLVPSTRYYYATETRPLDNTNKKHGELRGQFETAPLSATPTNLSFCVMTCQGYPDRDHRDGHPIYPSMQALNPSFVSLTGDLIYYDNDAPSAVTPELARLHWERMFSLPRQHESLRHFGTYWLKDDHDTLRDDAWPGKKLGKLTFAEGQEIFRQQAPLSGLGYRTFRWGRDLQIWLTDGRDFRSKNSMPDGPDKTIWGNEQKQWFKETVLASDASWKILISPTPIVGPDRPRKNDNHSNSGFAHEGREIRSWIQENAPDNFLIVCGDRHWQYHSVDPQTNVQEFSVGPASNSHAGGTPGLDKKIHRFHRVQGGFLNVLLNSNHKTSTVTLQLRDVDGRIAYEWKKERSVAT